MGFRPISGKNLSNLAISGNKKGPPQGAKAYVIWDVRLCGYYYLGGCKGAEVRHVRESATGLAVMQQGTSCPS